MERQKVTRNALPGLMAPHLKRAKTKSIARELDRKLGPTKAPYIGERAHLAPTRWPSDYLAAAEKALGMASGSLARAEYAPAATYDQAQALWVQLVHETDVFEAHDVARLLLELHKNPRVYRLAKDICGALAQAPTKGAAIESVMAMLTSSQAWEGRKRATK